MLSRSLPVVALALAFLSADSHAADRTIRWKASRAGQTGELAPRQGPSEIQRVVAAVARSSGERHLLLQFERAVDAYAAQTLESQGIRLLQSLGGQAWFAAVTSATPSTAGAGIVMADRVRAQWKVHPAFEDGQTPDHAIVAGSPEGAIVATYVLFHADVDIVTEGTSSVSLAGGRVMDRVESIKALVVELPRSNIGLLAAQDAVMWIEPPLPRMSDVALANDSNRARVQADIVQGSPYGLDGTGVNVLVYDGGYALASHGDFAGRVTVRDASGLSDHATHVSGTIGASGLGSGGTFAGMAPGVTIQSYGFEYDGTGIFLYSNPGDIEADYGEAINVFGAHIANNSIGSNTEPNGFQCNIQGDYGATAMLIDAIVGGSLGEPFRVVWANGNERQGSRCDIEGFGDYYSTAPPATAKNHITVGALNSNDDTMTSFSSWGPTDDGRIKPDISGPGCQSGGDGGVTSTNSAGAYNVKCGTSMSSPTVTGVCALLLESYRTQFGGADPRNSTLKVLLAQNAVDNGNPGPDYQFGYGSVRVQDTVDDMLLGNFREGSVAYLGSVVAYEATVVADDPELRLTMAWDDVPGTPNVLPALVNDLDLVVVDPGGQRHHVWTLDPADPAAHAVRTAEDHTNNIEQVLVSAPMAGTWRVEVRGHAVPQGPQPFSLASSHALASVPLIQIGLVDPLPTARVDPGVATIVTAQIVGSNDTLVGASPTLHFRYAGGTFLTEPLLPIGSDLYQAQLPAPTCAADVEYFLSAQGTISGTATLPPDAPTSLFQPPVGEETVVFQDDFQADQGWTVQNVSLTGGAWERGVPSGGGGRNDPAVDFDGSGSCFLTDNLEGNSDVDGGPTILTSPVIDLSGEGPFHVRYAQWFANDDFDVDEMLVEVSNDDGDSWTTVESFQNTNGWQVRSWPLADHVTPTSQVRVRFSVIDNPNDSVTEAALDAFEVLRAHCSASIPDCNSNAIADADDIASGRSGDANGNGVPDECESGGFRLKLPVPCPNCP